ncbi:hypothetical protein Pcinc_033831 [Petrolisthes cinctipes]|uniref:Uncharacterized protein n=1 Tax=Petrolisthes cinctipes TaxID=88211 RepID=A0AAE1ERE1_PETCI|nr:hypothetical protein Pcinc_033831 [Petrolisthes cinctipes]
MKGKSVRGKEVGRKEEWEGRRKGVRMGGKHPTKEDIGEERGQLKFGEQKVKTVPELPDTFTNVRLTFCTKKKPSPPQSGVTHLSVEATIGNGERVGGVGYCDRWASGCDLVSPPCFTEERKAI